MGMGRTRRRRAAAATCSCVVCLYFDVLWLNFVSVGTGLLHYSFVVLAAAVRTWTCFGWGLNCPLILWADICNRKVQKKYTYSLKKNHKKSLFVYDVYFSLMYFEEDCIIGWIQQHVVCFNLIVQWSASMSSNQLVFSVDNRTSDESVLYISAEFVINCNALISCNGFLFIILISCIVCPAFW